MNTIANMTTAEMVAEYNALTGKSIKKFSSRAAGEKQLTAVRAAQPQPQQEVDVIEEAHHIPELGISHCPCCGIHLSNGYTTNTDQRENNLPLLDKHEYMCLGCAGEFGPLIKGRSAKRSAAISNSWNDADVAAKRSRRDHVTVNGSTYRSVRAAFGALKLPLNQHIRFRMALKESGTGVYEHGDKEYEFTLAPKAE